MRPSGQFSDFSERKNKLFSQLVCSSFSSLWTKTQKTKTSFFFKKSFVKEKRGIIKTNLLKR